MGVCNKLFSVGGGGKDAADSGSSGIAFRAGEEGWGNVSLGGSGANREGLGSATVSSPERGRKGPRDEGVGEGDGGKDGAFSWGPASVGVVG